MADASNDHAGGPEQRHGSSRLERPARPVTAAYDAASRKIGFETESTWQRDTDLEAKVAGQSTKDLRGKALLTLTFAALGVIYGDLGTSPLYAMQAVFTDPPRDPEDVVQVVSVIFWTLTLLALVKYVLLVLSANDNGEGGTFAMYSLLCRAIGIGPYGQQLPIDTELYNYDEHTFLRQNARCGVRHPAGAWLRAAIRRSKCAQVTLLILVVVAAAMLMGDGTLTPSISVLSAVSGLRLASDQVTQPMIVGITIVILVLLFGLQRFGTHTVSSIFAPVILVWFLFNAGIGFYNLSAHSWGVWKAVSPSYAVQQFTRDFHTGWLRLGGVVLAVTGVEAMYADLGHFSRPAVSLSFLCVVYPCLVVTYFGQAAHLMDHPETHDDPYWHAIPTPVFWPMLVVATLATIVASQALISGAFSLMRQAMMLGVFPKLTVMHTSEHVAGQVYIEEVNFLLMIGCIAVVAGFRDTVALGNAYGVAVVTVMFCTTILFSLIMLVVWQLHPLLVAAFFLFFGLIEGLFLSSNYLKVPSGGWVALLIGAFVAGFKLIYWYGSRKKAQYTRAHTMPIAQLYVQDAGNGEAPCGHALTVGQHCILLPRLRLATTGQVLGRTPGLSIIYSETVAGAPPVLQQLLHNVPMVFEVNVLLTLRFIPIPYISTKERFLVRASRSLPGFYHVVARYGYMDVVDQNEAFIKDLVTRVAAYMQHADMEQRPSTTATQPPDSPVHHTIDMQRPDQFGKWQPPSPDAAAAAAAGGSGIQAPALMTWSSMDVSKEASALLNMEPEAAVSAARRLHLAAASMPIVRHSGSNSRANLQRLSTVAERRVRMALVNLGSDALTPSTTGPAGSMAHGSSSFLTVSAWAARASASTGEMSAVPQMQVPGATVAGMPPGNRSSAFAANTDGPGASSTEGLAQGLSGGMPSSQTADAMQRTLSQPQKDLLLLLDAYKRHKVYIIGRSEVRCAPGSNYAKQVLIGLYRFIVSNTRTVTDAWGVPRENLLEVILDVKV